MSTQLILAVGQLTDPGRVRSHNEDNLASVPPEGTTAEVLERKGHLLLVADGMGGHAAGATASGIAVQQTMQAFYEDGRDDLRASLERAFRQANTAIFDESHENLAHAGMGTTMVAAICQDSRFIVANVGDSRAYLIRDGGIRQITQDHSWVAEAVRQNTLTPEQARHHPRRNVITRSLGNRQDVEVDFFEERLLAGDILILCSDGLSGPLYDEEIRDTVLALEPQAAAERLVSMANERGGPDNITVLIARVVQVAQAAAPKERDSLPLMLLGCLGLLIAALVLALAILWTLGGGILPVPPTVTSTWTAVPPTTLPTSTPTETVPPSATSSPSPSATIAPSATPELPTPTDTVTSYPTTATAVTPPTVTVAPYPGLATETPTPTITSTIASPTTTPTVTPTATNTPAITIMPNITPTPTITPTITITPTATITTTL